MPGLRLCGGNPLTGSPRKLSHISRLRAAASPPKGEAKDDSI